MVDSVKKKKHKKPISIAKAAQSLVGWKNQCKETQNTVITERTGKDKNNSQDTARK
jgi:hypothetical protein